MSVVGLRPFFRRVYRYRLAYLMILPTALLMLTVHFMPSIEGFIMSMLKLNQFTLRYFLRAPFIGLENYRSILTDPGNPVVAGITGAARNTLFYTIVVNIGTLGLGLVLALLLNRRFPGRRLARTLVLLPWVVPTYAVGLLWGAMWLRESGVINMILVDWLHLLRERPFWLIGPNAFWAVVIPTIWRFLPFNTIMILAGLQVIPDELYEAASIDGASAFQRFRYITVPLLMPVLAIMLLWGVIFTAFGYNIVIMMFGNGGGFPGEYADLLMPAITRQSFGLWQFGLGAAASILMMLFMMIFVAIWLRVFRNVLTQEGSL